MEYRKKKFAQRRTQAVWLMEVAIRFEIWCAENDRDNNFSTFCNDFGFPLRDGMDRGDVYAKLIRLISFAYTLVDGMASEA